MLKNRKQQGFIVTYILIFGVVFSILISAALTLVLSQIKQAKYELSYEQSLHIAEAGLSRYKWYLTHKAQELSSGSEIGCPPSNCQNCPPCQYEYSLPGIGDIGEYRLDVEEERACGITTAVKVVSTGWTSDFPNLQRKIKVSYIKPTVAEYSYILNDNVWAGSDRIVQGPYHSNGGIRMDGSNNSLVTSEQDEWVCTDSFGCSSCPSVCHYQYPQGCLCPGVFTTANGDQSLFRTGVSHFDFEGITVDLGQIKSLTQPLPEGQGKGIYLPPSNAKGYHVILQGRNLKVYKINELSKVEAYSKEEGYHWEYSIISEEDGGTNYSLSDCGLIFIEDNVWIEGTIKGKISLVAADLITPSQDRDIWIKGNINYAHTDDSDGFVLIGQNNVFIVPDSPNYLTIDGVVVAQKGHFGRNYYNPYWYPSYSKKENLTIHGTIVSNGRVGTQWTSGGTFVSGYRERINIYDPKLSLSPPSFLPPTSEEFRYRGWQEIQ